jgi:hypothetical protein
MQKAKYSKGVLSIVYGIPVLYILLRFIGAMQQKIAPLWSEKMRENKFFTSKIMVCTLILKFDQTGCVRLLERSANPSYR